MNSRVPELPRDFELQPVDDACGDKVVEDQAVSDVDLHDLGKADCRMLPWVG